MVLKVTFRLTKGSTIQIRWFYSVSGTTKGNEGGKDCKFEKQFLNSAQSDPALGLTADTRT